jgi:hypothetical protein
VDLGDGLLTVLMLVAPVVVGRVFGHWLGRKWIGVTAAVLVGVLLTFGGLGLWYLDAPVNPGPYDCYECSQYWGRWMDTTMFMVWLPLTILLWSVGVAWAVAKRRVPA